MSLGIDSELRFRTCFFHPNLCSLESVSKSQEQPVIVGPPPPLVSETPISSTNANENNSNKDYEGV